MTKLLEWLTVLAILVSLWISVVTNKIETDINKQYPNFVLFSPIIFAFLFAVYALTVILYRVFTFNNCEDAAAELQEEIKEARNDLTRLGFRFKNAPST